MYLDDGRIVLKRLDTGPMFIASLALLGMLATTATARAQGVAPATSAALPVPDENDTREIYERNYVAFESVVFTNLNQSNRRQWVAYRGKYHRPIDGEAFYLAIERPDLLAAYKRQQRIKGALIVGGIVLMVASPFVLFKVSRTVGFAGFAAGGACTLAGWMTDSDAIDESEAREAADRYNKELKRRLGLTPPAPSSSAPAPSFTWSPFVVPSAVGLALGGQFWWGS